jgi:hypothetical protein
MVSRRIHDSAVLAPKASVRKPTGCLSSRCRSREEKYPTAENPGTFSGLQICHSPWISVRGSSQMAESKQIGFGIDFGTTNSVVGARADLPERSWMRISQSHPLSGSGPTAM